MRKGGENVKIIKELVDDIRHNIHEAREKMEDAYRLQHKDKLAADWYRDMAAAHLKFNEYGHSNVTRLINEARSQMGDNPMLPGMLAVYEDMHADVMKEAAEVQAMISTYK